MRADYTPLRIAIVSETWIPEVNGVAMTVARLVEGLRSCGHSVQVIRPRQKVDTPHAGNGDVLVAGMPLPGYPGLQLGLLAGKTLKRIWHTERPHVVHIVTEGPLGWSALRQARALGIPVTSSYHTHFDGYSKHYGARFLTGVVRAWLHRFHRATHCTMVPTRQLADRLSSEGVPNVRVLGRGVDCELFNPAKRSARLRLHWGIGERDLAVIHVGRLAPEKNLAVVARAFENIGRTHTNARMVWVGDGPARQSLQRRYPDHLFVGAKRGEELAAHYASGDIFLFASLTETYGNVVPEAMASGLAVVSYREAAAAELIVDGQSGLTPTPDDEAAFLQAAHRLATETPLREQCRAAAWQRVQTKQWQTVASEFESALLSAAYSNPHRSHDAPALAMKRGGG